MASMSSYMDHELFRIKREEHMKKIELELSEEDLDFRSLIRNRDGKESFQEKYIEYRLNNISPTKDSELYRILNLLMHDVKWIPDSTQMSLEVNVFDDIIREMRLFSDGTDEKLKLASGEILLHFANRLSNDAGITFAMACEMLLFNCGILLTDTNEIEIIGCYREAITCDINPDITLSLFSGPSYWDDWCWNASFHSDEYHYLPKWFEQYEVYLDQLMTQK